MEDRKLQLAYGQVPKVLLLGNGINRAYGFVSWDELIESIRTKNLTNDEQESMKSVPYPLQPVILTGDHLGTKMKELSGPLAELRASSEENEILRSFSALPVDAILTANYTYELEKALAPDFQCKPGRRCMERKVSYATKGRYETAQLHTYFSIEGNVPIWHIHGEAARHGTMVLGHYYYGKLLAKMQQYISLLLSRYKTSVAKQQNMALYSWLDYFMLGDIRIVGLSMALSELDLWWLINCKKRHFPNTKVTLYKTDIKPAEKLLAEAYGVTVCTDGFTGDYKAYYRWLCEELGRKL